jgi:hypothetical protein
MTPFLRFGIVAAGYVAAFLVASAAVAVRLATTSGPEASASSGMRAFGDSVLFVAVFGVLALVPTALALRFLRNCRPFWVGFAAAALAVAVTGVAAAVLYAVGRNATPPSPLATAAMFSVFRILVAPLVAPLLALGFFVGMVLSSFRLPRLALLAATLMEAGVTVYMGLTWFLPLLLQRP